MKHILNQSWAAMLIFLCGGVLIAASVILPVKREATPLFINDIKWIDGEGFLIAEKGTKQVSLYSQDFATIRNSWTFEQTPTGVTSSSEKIFVTTFDHSGALNIIDRSSGKIIKTIPTGSGTRSPLLNEVSNEVVVLNQFSDNVEFINLNTLEVTRKIAVQREPRGAVFDKSHNYLFVTNFLPAQRADVDTVAACVSVIDMKSSKRIKDIQLYNGSNALRAITLSPDGKYILVTHNLGRFQVPTNQLQQGWMNTSGMSLINIAEMRLEGTILLDDPEQGAAGIWDVKSTEDKIIITHSGTHDVSIIDYPKFIERFETYQKKEALAYDLRFMYGLRHRVKLKGNGPRIFALAQGKAYIPMYFSDDLNVLDLTTDNLQTYPLISNRTETDEMKGEKYFNDASYCFQGWQSCNGCHPGDGRTDGMNWDLMNDGIGNPKNCKSMLYSHVTPPSMISGIRAMANIAVRKGFTHIQFAEIPEESALCVDKYLMSLRPVLSPYLVNGVLSGKAKDGRKVFDQLNCGSCHSGPYYTDQKMYRIGNDIEFEKGWDTPTLIEVWRTAPYLFDGRAATMMDVFQKHKHGINRKVSKKDLEALVEYVNSL